jgi:hypothetical protein
VATLLLAAWSWAFIGALFHGEADQHRYCAEHRTFEEATPEGTVTARPAGATDHVSDAPAPAERHEACAFAEHGVRGEPDALPTVVVAPAVTPPTPPILLQRHVPPPIPLLHTAPKSSPPAA